MTHALKCVTARKGHLIMIIVVMKPFLVHVVKDKPNKFEYWQKVCYFLSIDAFLYLKLYMAVF